ncbi:urease accessory protein UreE [Candidatus Nitrosacidococcus tergens]|uniref:Urease accessory protein UreE n=1 Tax=Candidatus Nitrosacidococcus tergens TaxID=553981 RepID=A0A7G1Q914_9GAMM|nr:urease accessory protein UreE [Candidatus Nitrosacidococcus tergens]CAB1275063.1 Urease accessory protein UreE [Candidatus Nitrosacidococcus tergens]
MLLFDRRLSSETPATLEMAFTFEERERSQLRFHLSDGQEAAFQIERGTTLTVGDKLGTAEGLVLEIQAKPEELMEVQAQDSLDLIRSAYHLGNRHVRLQIDKERLRLPFDYVLEEMLVQIGVKVTKVIAPYQPESGAYGGGHHHSHRDQGEFHYEAKLHHFHDH